MAKERTFSIVINGLKESIDYVDSLNQQLDGLERRLNNLQGKTINISGGGASLPKASELSEIEKIEKEIAKVQEKQAAHQSEEYKALLMEKEALKQIESQAKASAKAMAGASNPNEINLNTMAGIKQRMRDLKLQHNNTDINSDVFKEQTREINELNQKLKELEAEYGVYSRNVGNYANGVAEGYKSAKAELKALKTEMQNLTVKQDRGIISEEEAERLKSLIPTVKELESSIKDAGKPMDALMDTMQSMVSLAQVGNGFAAFFGIDNDKIERSIQKLVGLQNAMQGLQKLQEQIDTKEGFGKYLSSANDSIDKFVAKITKAKIGVNGLEKSSKTATLAVKGFSTALKATGIGLAVWIGSEVIDGISKFIDNLKAADKAAEEFKQTLDDIADKSLAEGIGARTDIDEYISKIKVASGITSQEKKIIDELNKSYGDLMGYYYNISDWLTTLNTKRDEYVKLIEQEKRLDELRTLYETTQQAKEKAIETRKQAEAQVSLNHQVSNGITESIAYTNALKAESIATQQATSAALQYKAELFIINRLRAAIAKEAEEHPQSGSSSTTTTSSDSRVKAEEKIQELTLKLMKDGLAKKLRQLDEEKRQTLNKVKGTAQQKLDIEKKYDELRLKEIQDYIDNVNDKIESSAKSISNVKLDINASQIETVLEKVNFDIEKLEKEVPRINYLLSSSEYDQLLKENKTTKNNLLSTNLLREQLDSFSGELRTFLENNIRFIEEYGYYSGNVLKNTFLDRITEQKQFYVTQLDSLEGYIQDRKDLLKEQADEELRQSQSAAKEEWETRDKALKDTKKQLEEGLTAISGSTTAMTNAQQNAFNKMKENLETVEKQIKDNNDNYARQIEINKKKFDQRYIEIDKETKDELKRINNEYFETQLSSYRDFNSKLNQEMSKQPVYDRIGFGIINLSATRENFKEMESAAKASFNEIKDEKKRLSEKFKDKLIDEKDYNAILNQLNDLEFSAKENLESIKQSLEDLGGQWWGSIDQWIQQIGQATTSILSSISEITSNHYQEQIDQQQEYLDKLSDLYDKQQDITQKHADALNDIEDELASARGDRRQQLIDALNEEMAAQRASLAQEKRIEAEQERAEKKRKELEYQKAKSEKAMQEWQAAINAVMAVSMAAVNHWPIPAIPMMAMAAAVGAAQLAAVKSKPLPKYAEGGVIQGKSHSQGGVKVLGGTSEVEGGEMIINKVTTNENTELLYHINSKKRRLNIDDFIDFYSSGKKTITSISPMRKYANGGQLPTMRTDIDLNDRLVTAFEEYANTPTVVSVVDIQNASERVNNVRVLSGLNV